MSVIDPLQTGNLRVLRAEGSPATVPFARPAPVDWPSLSFRFQAILESGVLTNGPTVRELEEEAAHYLGVRHCIGVASCTAGLMLVLQAADLSGEVIVPSFTFSASAHAIAWNGLRPVFADCDPETLTLSPDAIEAVAGPRTTGILATHVFGTPCDVDALNATARRMGLRLFYDAAHGFGSNSQGRPLGGFGDAEVFSLSPTKLLVAGEGGIVATNNDEIARRVRMGRDYGNPGDYDCRFPGLNARMSELHAAMALDSFETLETRVDRRNEIAARYYHALAGIDGLTFPVVRHGDRSTFKDFTILIDPGLDEDRRARVAGALRARGVETRTYYAPPVHRQQAYRTSGPTRHLPVTEDACRRVLTLPMWSEMSDAQVDYVVASVRDAMRG